MKRTFFALLLAVLFASLVGMGTVQPTSAAPVHPAQPVAAKVQAAHCGFLKKADIVLHLGIAYIAFKKWLYDPYKAGKFKKGAPGRKVTIVKGVIAALVGVHELRVAISKANNCGAGARMQSLLNTITNKANALKNGAGSASNAAVGANVGAMTSAWNTINSLKGSL